MHAFTWKKQNTLFFLFLPLMIIQTEPNWNVSFSIRKTKSVWSLLIQSQQSKRFTAEWCDWLTVLELIWSAESSADWSWWWLKSLTAAAQIPTVLYLFSIYLPMVFMSSVFGTCSVISFTIHKGRPSLIRLFAPLKGEDTLRVMPMFSSRSIAPVS